MASAMLRAESTTSPATTASSGRDPKLPTTSRLSRSRGTPAGTASAMPAKGNTSRDVPHAHQEVGGRRVLLVQPEAGRQLLAEEDDVGLDGAAASRARGVLLRQQGRLDDGDVVREAAAGAAGAGGEGAVSVDDGVRGHAGEQLQAVDVLRVETQQLAALMQQPDEEVGGVRLQLRINNACIRFIVRYTLPDS